MFFLLSLFAGYLTCIFGFSHVHIIDGVRIVHSHPYQNGHESNNHSKAELILLHDISHFISLLPGGNSFDFTPSYRWTVEIVATTCDQIFQVSRYLLPLRGPPCL